MIASREPTPYVEPPRTRAGYPRENGPTISALLKELRDNLILLFRQEVALARGELKENFRSLGKQVVAMVVGGAVAFAGALVLLMGCASGAVVALAALGLDPDHAVWVGPLLVGVLVAAIGLGMLMSARRRLQTTSLMPKRTVQTLKEDSNWAKEKLHRS